MTCQLILLIRRATDALIPDLGGTVRPPQYDNVQTSLRHALLGYRLNMSLDRVGYLARLHLAIALLNNRPDN